MNAQLYAFALPARRVVVVLHGRRELLVALSAVVHACSCKLAESLAILCAECLHRPRKVQTTLGPAAVSSTVGLQAVR